jgi:hypothetical protein
LVVFEGKKIELGLQRFHQKNGERNKKPAAAAAAAAVAARCQFAPSRGCSSEAL